jgi:predicted transcriptional regulator
MKQNKTVKYTIYTVIWSNIRRHQYLLGMTDEQLSDMLGVSTRTLYAYDKNPAVLTLEKIESFLNETGIEMQMLISI